MASLVQMFAAAASLAKEMRSLQKSIGISSKLFTCPICQGKVMVQVGSNGHTRGKCETADCLSWIE